MTRANIIFIIPQVADIKISFNDAEVAELADARDSKSRSLYRECGFDSHLRQLVQILQAPFKRGFCAHLDTISNNAVSGLEKL